MACNPDFVLDTSTCAYDCATQQRCEIEPEPDIGGIGVILGYTITAWLGLLLLGVYYVTAYDPELDPFRPKGDTTSRQKYINVFDGAFLSLIRRLRWLDFTHRGNGTESRKVERTFTKCVIAFADIQIIAGIGILASGFSSLNCGLPTYHWQLIFQVAWFSSATHLSALSFLRHHLYNHRAEFVFRGACMIVLAVLLGLANYRTRNFTWSTDPRPEYNTVWASYYASCPYETSRETNSAILIMEYNMVLIAYGYTLRFVKTIPALANSKCGPNGLSVTLEVLSKDLFARWERSSMPLICDIVFPLAASACWVLHLNLALLTSYLAEVSTLTVSVIAGTRWLAFTKGIGPAAEDAWTFGQVLPLCLMAAPLLALQPLIPTIWGALKSRRAKAGREVVVSESENQREEWGHHPSPLATNGDAVAKEGEDTIGSGDQGPTEKLDTNCNHPFDRPNPDLETGTAPIYDGPGEERTTETTPPGPRIAMIDGPSILASGGYLLVIWPYYQVGKRIMTVGNFYFSQYGPLLVSFLVLCPVVETLWFTYGCWMTRIFPSEQVPSILHWDVLITLLTTMTLGFDGGLFNKPALIGQILLVASLLIAWAYIATKCSPSCEATRAFVSRRDILGVLAPVALCASAFVLDVYPSGNGVYPDQLNVSSAEKRFQAGIWAAQATAFHFTILAVEAILNVLLRRQHGRLRERVLLGWRVTLLFAVLAALEVYWGLDVGIEDWDVNSGLVLVYPLYYAAWDIACWIVGWSTFLLCYALWNWAKRLVRRRRCGPDP